MKVELIGVSTTLVFPPSWEFQDSGWFLSGPPDAALSGWWSLAPRAEMVERPNLDGSYAPANLLVSHRVVSVSAVFHGAPDECERQRHQVAALIKQPLRLVVSNGDSVQHTQCFIGEQPSIKNASAETFTVDLVLACPDPLKYSGSGESLSDWLMASGYWSTGSGGGLLFPLFDQGSYPQVSSISEPTLRFTESGLTNSIDAFNTGQAPVWPILEATGPLSSARWECDGHVVAWEGTLDEGNLLRIDTRSGDVFVGEFEAPTASIVEDDFFQIHPGSNTVSFSGDRNANYRVRWLHAWM